MLWLCDELCDLFKKRTNLPCRGSVRSHHQHDDESHIQGPEICCRSPQMKSQKWTDFGVISRLQELKTMISHKMRMEGELEGHKGLLVLGRKEAWG